MKNFKGIRWTLLALGLLLGGYALAALSGSFVLIHGSQGNAYGLAQFQNPYLGLVVSVINTDNGMFNNFRKDEYGWTPVPGGGYSAEHDGSAQHGSGNGGDPNPGGNGNGGTSNPSGPSTGGGLCWSCTGTVTPGVPRSADD